jgi:uncharacterized membrane protein
MPSLAPDRVERIIGWTALVLLAVVVTAIARGSADWAKVPWTIWLHLMTMMAALALTPAILWKRRGDTRHRWLGYVWVSLLAVTALDTFAIRTIDPGHLSWIHLLSAFTLLQLPIIIWSARSHNHARHRRAIRGLAIGALLIAGFFTLPFGRMLGHWLFG